MLAGTVGTMLFTFMPCYAGTAGEQAALDRPAVQVRQPQQAAILATAQAGRRIVGVGERGVALWSEDGGRNWHQATVPVSVTLTAVCFVDERVGWAVGHGAVILQTLDSGSTWSRKYEGLALAEAALAALSRSGLQQTESASASHLSVLKLLAERIADKPLLDVNFVDANVGFAVGAYGLLLRTEDGGHTWKLVSSKLDNPKALHLNVVRALGRSVLIAGEQGTAYLSTDGGDSFTSLVTSYRGSFLAAALLPSGGMVLAGLGGTLLASVDAGRFWVTVKLPTASGLTVVNVAADGALIVGAQSGQIFAYRMGDTSAGELSTRGPPMQATLIDAGDGALVAGGLRGIDRLESIPTRNP